MLPNLINNQVWFITGSQHLYGPKVLEEVAAHSRQIVEALNLSRSIPVTLVSKPVLTTPEAITKLCLEANHTETCVGLIMWMHTFSPAKMWISGLQVLNKPFAHLHTQFGRDIPWNAIDMDFMNMHQSAHGDREFGFINSRMRKSRKIIVGHWKDPEVLQRINVWCRVASAWHDGQGMKVARFGDNMREVAVTEGNKISAQLQFGYAVNGFGMGDLVNHIHDIDTSKVKTLVDEYETVYQIDPVLKAGGEKHNALLEAARIELGLRSFLEDGDFKAFTDTFENLHGLEQLPGIAVQRLMADGYGFGAEGDWKTAALVRTIKVMGTGMEGGHSFMEDYTYHFDPAQNQVLGAHMLEICPSIAQGTPSCEIHPLGIGGKADPVRLVFHGKGGNAINASLIDMGNRFRLLVNEVNGVEPTHDLPNLPVARVLWEPKPDLKTAAAAWILAGGAHHTCYSQSVSTEFMDDFADIAGIELLVINDQTNLFSFKESMRWNEVYYHLANGFG
jgi:L-arabinose isomerase